MYLFYYAKLINMRNKFVCCICTFFMMFSIIFNSEFLVASIIPFLKPILIHLLVFWCHSSLFFSKKHLFVFWWSVSHYLPWYCIVYHSLNILMTYSNFIVFATYFRVSILWFIFFSFVHSFNPFHTMYS